MAIFTLDLIPATPNLNGNTEKSLLDQLRGLMDSLRDVRENLSVCSDHWHGRNFLPQGSPEARIFRQLAEDAWRLRMDAIDSMHEEILTLALTIQGGGVKPEAAPSVPKGWDFVDGGASLAATIPDSNEAEDERINKLLAEGDGDAKA